MKDTPRLIERAFPLKQASLDSVHEKNVRHGHISTLHIWPARRPLAACRAALLATLLPDPGSPEERRKLCERIGGKVVHKVQKKKMPSGKTVDRIKEETEGGILSWIGAAPKSGSKKKKEEHRAAEQFRESELEWFRQEIRKAYFGRAPRVLDPFAGGGAIPLEAMRLGCETTAADINPVAWFLLKCTLEHPQQLAGEEIELPNFAFEDESFMADFFKAKPHLVGKTKKTKRQKAAEHQVPDLFPTDDSSAIPTAGYAWHVYAWGRWVFRRARKQLARYYPTYADFEPLTNKTKSAFERIEQQLVPVTEEGSTSIDALNSEFSSEYLANMANPRWIEKPPIAYLWARTIPCANCRTVFPLIKSRWLQKKDEHRVLLNIELHDRGTPISFSIERGVPVKGGNAGQKREHDRRLGQGSMSRSGGKCPCCGAISTMEDIRVCGRTGTLGVVPTAVCVEGISGKEFRVPTARELKVLDEVEEKVSGLFTSLPGGALTEPMPSETALGMRIPKYGFSKWEDVFLPRQLLAGEAFATATRSARKAIAESGYPSEWVDGIHAALGVVFDRFINYMSTICIWESKAAEVKQTFLRFALPITWDFSEANPLSPADRYYVGALSCVLRVLDTMPVSLAQSPRPIVIRKSAQTAVGDEEKFDAIVTDPPYYDAIPYSDLMDFFYVWMKRLFNGLSSDLNFTGELSPKWSLSDADGELIDDASRHQGDKSASKRAYEEGMAKAFSACRDALHDEGKLVIVFANKNPDAWETLVSAVIRAGFVVAGSWPIATEMRGGVRNFGRASLASSVWLVCGKRPIAARPGWDNRVLDDMRKNITERLREYWDAGIRGPDFVWAATGPALEAYSKHPIVKKANDPGQVMTVSEFLSRVRRMVVDFVVGQVLTGQSEGVDLAAADRMDAPTAYYLLHRHDFGLEEAPAGACILYSTACGISDRDLEATWNLISHKGSSSTATDDEDDVDPDAEVDPDADSDSSSKIVLKTWAQRKSKSIGYDAPGGNPVPLIDRVHRLMHLWKSGDLHKLDEYLDDNGLRRQELFKRLVQSLIELSSEGSEERKLLESLSNHVQAKGATIEDRQAKLAFDAEG